MMPTEFVAAAVAMLTDALAQLHYFRHKFFTCHLIKIRIQHVLLREASHEFLFRIELLRSRDCRKDYLLDKYKP